MDPEQTVSEAEAVALVEDVAASVEGAAGRRDGVTPAANVVNTFV